MAADSGDGDGDAGGVVGSARDRASGSASGSASGTLFKVEVDAEGLNATISVQPFADVATFVGVPSVSSLLDGNCNKVDNGTCLTEARCSHYSMDSTNCL
jgi:hypothetical protein